MTVKNIHTILISYGLSLNANTLDAAGMQKIQEAAPDASIIVIRNKADWEKLREETLKHVEVLFGRVRADWLSKMPRLHWVQLTSAGANRLLLDAPGVVQSDLLLTNTRGTHANQISEHILALMLTFARDLHHSLRRQLNHEWNRKADTRELEGATLGLIGVGKIGAKTAEKAKALGMRVLGLRRNAGRSDPCVDHMFAPQELHTLLSQSDWVVLTAALTAETRGILGEDEFRAMKKSACIINVARGAIIQEKALIKALRKGWIAGAGLDVFEREPLAGDSPLWEMENVLITPHMAGLSPYHVDRLIALFAENLRRYQSGREMLNLVDKTAGY